VAFRRDAAAIVWTQWHGNRLHIGQEILQPEDQGAVFGVADVRGRLASRALNPGGVKEMPYDPWNFRESAEILAERGLPMLEFTQGGARMGQASETLYELIVQRRLVHDGDPLMKRHVLSAVATPTDRGGWQISKRKSLERIDGCVALAMAADRAVTLRTAKTQGRQVEFA
jgi:phage terminase large subunit-like protein